MKRFSFPLDRVLRYRQAQARIEEAKLEQLHAEIRQIDAHGIALRAEREQAEIALVRSAWATGADCAAMERYRQSSARRAARLEQERIACAQRAAQQTQQVAERRRAARLLEKLRERRWQEWNHQLSHEIQQQADESHTARRIGRVANPPAD